MTQNFLVEIGTQELPPTNISLLSESFANHIAKQLTDEKLNFDEIQIFATPRRLAVLVKSLDEMTPKYEVVVWGPPKKVAFNNGKPSKAAQAFAKKNGLDVNKLIFENDGKADKLIHRSVKKGQPVTSLLEKIVLSALDKLPIAKRMRWGSRRTEFVRPVQWVVMMFGQNIIKSSILGIESNNLTYGHRFHCDTTLEIANAGIYQSLLATSGHVIASFSERREKIRTQVTNEGKKAGGTAVIDEDLLNEVTGLVEWPVALTGSFDQQFLTVPAEALIYSMKEHQKYFHVVDKVGKLMPYFITVSNIESSDPSQVISGNERVIRPRLSDASFFYETDKKTALEDRVEKLKTIIFQNKLGTLFDKTQRIQSLAVDISKIIGGNKTFAERSSLLCKTDLLSDMVIEFDKMQGVAGYYYALNDGENDEVAVAIKEHYLPKHSGDKLPSNLTGCALALADRLDTLIGIFGIGQKPGGAKDPFALRRASISILRIIIEKQFTLDLKQLLSLAASYHSSGLFNIDDVVTQTFDYMVERFRAIYDEQNIAVEVFMAVSAKKLTQPLDIDLRVHAVHSFSQLPQAQALASANKRVSNILAKQKAVVIEELNSSLLIDPAEIELAELIIAKTKSVTPLLQQNSYKEALASLADLRQPVDKFFDNVMVMVDEIPLRNNRLALLKQLHDLFFEIADISLLVPAK